MKEKKAKTAKTKAQAVKEFHFIPLAMATNNLNYWRDLALHAGFIPVDCYLIPRADHYGTLRETWNKEVSQSFDMAFEKPQGKEFFIEGIAFNVTGEDRPRRRYDSYYDNIGHILTGTITRDKTPVKWLVVKPLAGNYLNMKSRTQNRVNSIYEKAHALAAK